MGKLESVSRRECGEMSGGGARRNKWKGSEESEGRASREYKEKVGEMRRNLGREVEEPGWRNFLQESTSFLHA